MSKTTRIKRAMLRDAVRSNLDEIQGRYRAPRRRAGRLSRVARAFFFVTVPVALFGSSYFVSDMAGGWLETRRTAETARAEEARAKSERARAEVEEARAAAKVAEARRRDRVALDTAVAALDPVEPVEPRALDRALFPLAVRRVVLDPGHGGKNPGTESPGGLAEKEVALDISQRLAELLEEAAYEVALTRTADETVSLEDRALFANSQEGDIFVSVHLNWLETRQVRGIETYFLGATDDPYLEELAKQENQDSGYSLADYRAMLEEVYAGVRQDESRRLATAVQNGLFEALRRVNPQLQDRGVKTAPFLVLTTTEMPAILAEVSCLSNEKESRLLTSPGYRQFIAEALFNGIDFYARSVGGADQRGT